MTFIKIRDFQVLCKNVQLKIFGFGLDREIYLDQETFHVIYLKKYYFKY